MAEKKKPKIRFKGFNDDWEQREFSGMAVRNSVMALCSSELPSVEYEDIVSGQGTLNKDVREKAITKYGIRFAPNDVLFGKLRAYLKNWFLPDFSGVAVGDFWVLQPSETDSLYLYYLIQTPAFQVAANQSIGTKMPRADWNLVSKTMFKVPKEQREQSKIGQTLQSIDDLITLYQCKYDKLQNFKKAMLEKMFPKDGADVPEIRFKGFADAWEKRKVGELTNVASAARVHKEEWASSGIPFFRSSDVVSAYKGTENEKAFISCKLYEQLARVSGKLEKDDILITGGGSIGIPYVVPNNEPLYSKDADLIWVKSSEEFNSRYLYTYFTSPEFRRYLSGISHIGTIAHYTIEQVKETPICLPSIDEQNKIGSYFTHLDNLITLHQRELEKLQNIKKALLDKMFV